MQKREVWAPKTMQDEKRIEGHWKIEALIWDGQNLGGRESGEYIFENGRALFCDPTTKLQEECRYRLDASTVPGQFHLIPQSGGKIKTCIYEFRGDDCLLLCESSSPNAPLPDKMESLPGDERHLIHLIRLSKAAET